MRANSLHRLTRSSARIGASLNALTSFWLPLVDSGAGAVNTTPIHGVGSAAFTRATTAWTKLSTGLWASVATGIARSSYLGADTTVGAYGGYFAEAAATNLCLQSRDMTSVSWTKVTMTAAKDQVGIDGVTNSASSLLATAGAATCLQTITEAATASALSMFIKRITGTGAVTIQQGATTLAVTGLINSSTYTRVELDATVLNPAIGIILGTNGDKIAVDMVQFENGGFATSPIPTTTVAVTRNADVLVYPIAGNFSNTAGAAYVETAASVAAATGTVRGIIGVVAANVWGPMTIQGASAVAFNSLDSVNTATSPVTTSFAVANKLATSWSGTSMKAFMNGAAGTGATYGSFAATVLGIGNTANINQFNGCIKNIKLWTVALTDGQIASL